MAALDPWYQAQETAATTEQNAQVAASQLIVQARISGDLQLSSANVYVAGTQAAVDYNVGYLRIQGQAFQAQESAAASVQATTLTTIARTSASNVVNAAQTAAAQSVSSARIQSDYQVASARISAQTTTTAASVAATQTLATARVNAATTTSTADIAAAQLDSSTKISTTQTDWNTRISTTTTLVNARVAAAQSEANAQVAYDQATASAEIASNQAQANARQAADQSVSAARLASDQLISVARIAAASTQADAQIQVATIETTAAIAVATTETNAQISVANIDPSNTVADIELESTTYAVNQDVAGREYSSTSAYNAGVFAANQELAGSNYKATQQLVGAQYTSDRDTATTLAVAETRAAADNYVSVRQYNGVVLAAQSDYNRFELKLGAVEQAFGQVWPTVSTAIGSLPASVQTPGYSTPPPAISTLDPVPQSSPISASVAAGIQARAALAASLFGQGMTATAPLPTMMTAFLTLDGNAVALAGQSDFALQAADIDAKNLLGAQQALAEQFDSVNKVALAAEQNLVARQTGLLGAIPRLVGVSSGN